MPNVDRARARDDSRPRAGWTFQPQAPISAAQDRDLWRKKGGTVQPGGKPRPDHLHRFRPFRKVRASAPDCLIYRVSLPGSAPLARRSSTPPRSRPDAGRAGRSNSPRLAGLFLLQAADVFQPVFRAHRNRRIAAANQNQIHQQPRRAAVAVVERMNIHQPAVRRERRVRRVGRGCQASRRSRPSAPAPRPATESRAVPVSVRT